MNRRDRRNMEKKLGLIKHKNSLPLHKRIEGIRENIIAGKEKQAEMKETRRLQEEGKVEEVDNTRIASIATELMVSKDMSYIDALEEAKEMCKQETTKEPKRKIALSKDEIE